MTPECNDTQRSECMKRFDSIDGKLDRIHESLCGDVEKPGLAGRVRDLEGAEGRRVWFIRLLTTAVVGLLVKLVMTGH